MEIDGVEYKQVPGYQEYYAGYNGNIYSSKTNKILSPGISCNGYKMVYLMDSNHKRNTKRVNRIVALAWIPNPNNLPHVHHIDENKLNNSVDNLKWVTRTENMNAGTVKERIGKTNSKALLNNNKRSKPVVLTNVKDGSKLYFPSTKEARRHGFRPDGILNGSQKTTKGYYAEYADKK